MKKQLNTEAIKNELEGSVFFPSPKPAEQFPAPLTQEDNPSLPQQTKQVIPERVNVRTPQRPNGKRIITRNSFEIYEDQMDSLRRLSLQEKMEGKLGSMSQMVRTAIDDYLKKQASEQ